MSVKFSSLIFTPGSTDPAVRRWIEVYPTLQEREGGLRADGGYNEIKGDRGGATKFGLSLRWLALECALDPALKAKLDEDNNGAIDKVDVRGLDAGEAEDIYHSRWWTRPGFATLPRPFDMAMFDQGVNAGSQAAVKLLQRTSNALSPGAVQLKVDGDLGRLTRTRLDRLVFEKTVAVVLKRLREATADRYRAIAASDPAQRQFLKGWLRRAAELGDV